MPCLHFYREDKDQRGEKKWLGQDHGVSWWQKQYKYLDRQILDPEFYKNCIFPICSARNLPSIPCKDLASHTTSWMRSVVFWAAESPSAFSHKLQCLIYSKDTWLHIFSLRLGPPTLAELGNTHSPVQSSDCICVSLSSQPEYQANEY